jgi:benzoyl-CoA 2,3-dioxygenase component A
MAKLSHAAACCSKPRPHKSVNASAPEAVFNSAAYGSTLPPWSAAHAYTNLYGPKTPTQATVVGNFKVNEAGTSNETHHIVIDFGQHAFPVLEGQSVAIVPPGAGCFWQAAPCTPVLHRQPTQWRAYRVTTMCL